MFERKVCEKYLNYISQIYSLDTKISSEKHKTELDFGPKTSGKEIL